MLPVFGRLALITLLVLLGVNLWYGRVEKRIESDLAPAGRQVHKSRVQTVAQAQEQPRVDHGIIVKRNIFDAAMEPGQKTAPVDRVQAALDDLEETSMKLVLLGTVSGDKNDARAIIRDEKSKKEDLYKSGDSIQGAIISRIERGRVVLRVDGNDEVLTIKERENSGFTGSARTSSPNRAPTRGGLNEEMGGNERRVPEALPRRRISFRSHQNNTEQSPPEATVPEEMEQMDAGGEPPLD